MVWAMMEPRYRKTFYKHRTMRSGPQAPTHQHASSPALDARLPFSFLFRTYLTEWNCTLATHGALGVGHDACFAELFSHYSPYHWPAPEMLRAWLAQWPEWERAADPPSWFTEEWQQHALGLVPPELLPEEVRPRSTVTSSRR